MKIKEKNKSLTNIHSSDEAFSALKANIQYSSLNKSIKSIIITSANSNEGKSTVSINLAVSFSQSNKRVLLMDCDFRNSSIHKHFNLNNNIGLSDILLGNHKIKDCLQSSKTKNLFLITSGNRPQNPADLLSSNLMTQLMSELKENFDIIILDTPSMLQFADSQILSAINDGTIIVSKYGKTDKESILKCKEIVNSFGGNIIGSIINEAPKKLISL